MKKIKTYSIYSLILLFSISCQSIETKNYFSEINTKREKKDLAYADSTSSPLNPIHLNQFTGLEYFDIEPDFKIIANLMATPEEKAFEMATSTDRKPSYRKYGILSFKIKNKDFTLAVYQNMDFINDSLYGDHLFVPFQDLTSSKESYGGGRYLDIIVPRTEQVDLDFNLAYNPYCAYDARWSCVIPPPENFLEAKITAGEKSFSLAEH